MHGLLTRSLKSHPFCDVGVERFINVVTLCGHLSGVAMALEDGCYKSAAYSRGYFREDGKLAPSLRRHDSAYQWQFEATLAGKYMSSNKISILAHASFDLVRLADHACFVFWCAGRAKLSSRDRHELLEGYDGGIEGTQEIAPAPSSAQHFRPPNSGPVWREGKVALLPIAERDSRPRRLWLMLGKPN